eukprot:TRINITY_DN8866_c0_g1_i1.p1 TRINITY_DN8866_c0_g1~~TRINITY_DN8866_c0_g1_i1.p1  ORF type:complete len:368 (+),score=118.10 TRINITY_DN8866_c0_g1_i1:42-1106(+)
MEVDEDKQHTAEEAQAPAAAARKMKTAERIEERRTRAEYDFDNPQETTPLDSYHTFAGVKNAFDLESWKNQLRIEYVSHTNDELVFDIIGIDASVANAFRRILLSEVPTVCIETVYMQNNTSVLHDEILAHRLGLIPIKADPASFEFRTSKDADCTEVDTVVFKLQVKCQPDPQNRDLLLHETVTSGDLVWIPQGDQATTFEDNPIRPVNDDIVIAKLARGQEIECDLYAHKGIGKDHAKFSPVATASYRILPDIRFLKPVTDDLAQKLCTTCPMGVFDIEDGVCVAKRPRNCTMCRECVRNDWANYVKLGRILDHFIFSIESTGILTPRTLFIEAVQILMKKCDRIKEEINDL